MRGSFSNAKLVIFLFLSSATALHLGAQSRTANGPFDPHDLSGVWWVPDPGVEKILARGETGDASKCETCHIPEHTVPEPSLTAWAKKNLPRMHLMAPNARWETPAAMGPEGRNNCDPIGVPAQYWYTQLAPFEFVVTPDRIFQFFEEHHEWRVIWLNRDHPRDLPPTFMGDSVGRWEGNTLIVDTTGYNGKDIIEPVGVDHLMSDAFHLVERWHRISSTEMELDLTYYDSKVWGDQAWGGLKKTFVLQPDMQLSESYCSVEDNQRFDDQLLKVLAKPPK